MHSIQTPSADKRGVARMAFRIVATTSVAFLLLAGCTAPRVQTPEQPRKVSVPEALSMWREDAPARTALVAYVEAITDVNGPDWIPPESRIAVFDLDGTLFCETDPNYFDYTLTSR